MRYYVLPGLVVLGGASALAVLSYGLSERTLARRTSEQVATMRRSFESPFQRLSVLVMAGLSLIAAVATVLAGSGTAWLWLLALLLQLVLLRRHRLAALRLAARTADPPPPTEADSRRLQRTYRFTIVAAVAFLAGQTVQVIVADESTAAMALAPLLLVAVGAALAAGWSAVWVSPTGNEHRSARGRT